jgi:hypothetical protein|tara:strand:+ start:218 stop:802 length:585 start_codon:yes stop_codon:yes gene_type:complete
MKNLFKLGICLASVMFMMAFKSYRAKIINPIVKLPVKGITIIPTEPLKVGKIELIVTSHQAFLDAIGFRESGNRYNIVNRYGYMGKYQFGRKTLRGLGFKMSKEEFLNSPLLQEQAMHALLKQNKRSLRKYIAKYDGKYIHGVLVTESGLLAAAHLGGAGSVKKWFRTGKVRKDGNGVKITSYMERFGGYDLNV